MEILIEYFEIMNYKVIKVTDKEIYLFDLEFNENIVKTISEATSELIEMIESKIKMDFYNTEATEQFKEEIKQLKVLI